MQAISLLNVAVACLYHNHSTYKAAMPHATYFVSPSTLQFATCCHDAVQQQPSLQHRLAPCCKSLNYNIFLFASWGYGFILSCMLQVPANPMRAVQRVLFPAHPMHVELGMQVRCIAGCYRALTGNAHTHRNSCPLQRMVNNILLQRLNEAAAHNHRLLDRVNKLVRLPALPPCTYLGWVS